MSDSKSVSMPPMPQSSQPPCVPAREKPVVIGVYGVSGCGKSYLLKQLREILSSEHFTFHDGSGILGDIVPGGLEAFKRLDKQYQDHWREVAISSIGEKCAKNGKAAIIAGHFMFWYDEESPEGQIVCTTRDLETYTHIIYLQVNPLLISARRRGDKTRKDRSSLSVDHLREWQGAELVELRRRCRQHNILFLPISAEKADDIDPDRVSRFMNDFRVHNEWRNEALAEAAMHKALEASCLSALGSELQTILVFDADRTLAAEDSGSMFWEIDDKRGLMKPRISPGPLPGLFGGPMGYSYTAFRQAMLLYEETVDDQEFDVVCETVASQVKIHPQIQALLQHVSQQDHVTALVVTCGLRLVWEKVLAKHGLDKAANVIGGGRLSDGYVVTAEVKAALARRLRDRDHYGLLVWAFGDSVLDLPMLKEAHEAIVVVGELGGRSRTMDSALPAALEDGLRARQVLLPPSATERLDKVRLPLVELDERLYEAISRRRIPFTHATDQPGTKLLASLTRDANVAGPALRQRHHQIGWYMAVHSVTPIIGVEEYELTHVLKHRTHGHQLYREKQTLILAVMRAGEPMASGVNAAFPLATLLHAKLQVDIKEHHLKGRHTVILVDAVINTGKTVVDLLDRIRELDATIRIVIVAGIVQADAISEGILAEALKDPNIVLTALRLSETKYKGSGATDTGNRLFNTTYLD